MNVWNTFIPDAESGFLASESTDLCPYLSILKITSPDGVDLHGHKGVTLLHVSVWHGHVPEWMLNDRLHPCWSWSAGDGWLVKDAYEDMLLEKGIGNGYGA
jgi:hypothetical protein